MNYVLDSSVAFKWLVPEADTDKALRIRDDYHNAIIQLLAPDFFPAEVIHKPRGRRCHHLFREWTRFSNTPAFFPAFTIVS